MKKKIALLLAIVFVIALFAGCGGNNSGSGTTNSGSTGTNTGSNTGSGSGSSGTGSNTGDTTDSGDTTPADGGEEVVDEGPYCLAAGKWELNADGYSSAPYEYTQPLSTTDETFTRWTTNYTPQYIPESGYGSINTWAGVEEYTGVHIEYNIVPSNSRDSNFSVLLASDELMDIMDQARVYWTGTQAEAFDEDEGYFVDIMPYKEYMPNYLYILWSRSFIGDSFSPKGEAVATAVNLSLNIMPGFSGMLKNPAPGMGFYYRQDYLDELGFGKAVDALQTYDDLSKFFEAVKVTYGGEKYGFCTFSVGELGVLMFSGFNTIIATRGFSYIRVIDGQLVPNGRNEDDRDALTLCREWIANGYAHPNWQSFQDGTYLSDITSTDVLLGGSFPPSGIDSMTASCENPNCNWQAVSYARKTRGQVLEYGHRNGAGFHFGSCWINKNCENIELIVSYWDWWFSDFGSDWTSWGPEGETKESEGVMWYYDENGNRYLTDWCLNFEGGMAWCMCLYGADGLVETCLQDHMRNYAYPGGEVFAEAFDLWTEKNYGGNYDLPAGITFEVEESDRMNAISADLNTYYQENYPTFLTGDRPLSDWDAFQNELDEFGLAEYMEIYQGAYDRFMAA